MPAADAGADDLDERRQSCLPVRRHSSSSPHFSLPKIQLPHFASLPSVSIPHLSLPLMSSTSRSSSTHEQPSASPTEYQPEPPAATPSLSAPSTSPSNARAALNNPNSNVPIDQPSAVLKELRKLSITNGPKELLVLVHGLQGDVADFTFFEQLLLDSAACTDGQVLVHATDVNTEKTHDGIGEGGTRVADDIRRIVSMTPSLTSISLVGFSLGGMYSRFAVALLYDPEHRTVAGLMPKSFICVASPNLGVRKFGVYRFIPDPLIGATKLLLGKTGDQLVMKDSETNPVVLAMSTDDNDMSLPFISALRAFKHRVLYGNMRQDFMVNWGSSVMDASIQGMSGAEVHEAIASRAQQAGSETIDCDFDDKGCKVAFTYSYPARDQAEGGKSEASRSTDSAVSADSAASVEHGMAERLQSIGWKVVAIDFPTPLPIAHNRIMAMSRTPLHTRMNAGGRRAVRHLVDMLVSDYDGHEKVFEAVRNDDLDSGAGQSTKAVL